MLIACTWQMACFDADLDWPLHLGEREVGLLLLGERVRVSARSYKRKIIVKT